MKTKILALGFLWLFLILFPYCDGDGTTPITPTTTTTTTTPTTTTTTTTTTIPTPVVQPGEWTATADFGTFDFIVSSDSNYITKIAYNFSNFSCGGVTLSGGISISTSPGWPISNLSFEIERYLDFSNNQLLTINGTFSSSGNQASGTWEAKFYGSTCSGSWQGSPKS